MIIKISDNIFSPLGFTAADTYRAIRQGNMGGQYYEHAFGIPEPCFVSLIADGVVEQRFNDLAPSDKRNQPYTRFEKLLLSSAMEALSKVDIDVTSSEVIFILSTTKGNIRLLEEGNQFASERVNLWSSALVMQQFFNLAETPIVVSNACISGVAAQILAVDYLQSHRYRYAVVVGAEELSRFIISGFQSFKALSSSQCRPFDADRVGLNLGEAAATVVYQYAEPHDAHHLLTFMGGGLCNDANHISAPSREGEGLFRAFQQATCGMDLSSLAFINAHGTATRYNDDMEATAIARAGLDQVPVNSYKGYLGHTLGAAGVVETILSSYALADGVVLPTVGYQHLGVVKPICVNDSLQRVEGDMFIKLISGFGGSNAVALFKYIE